MTTNPSSFLSTRKSMMGFVLVFLCMTSFGIWQLIPHHAIQSHGTAFIIDGIAYESNNDPIAIYELADITTHGITGEGTQESPYLIENRIINIADNNIGIYIYLNAVYRIRNCIINGGMYGIRMQYGQDSIVEHCLIANAYYGINTDTTTQNITIQYCRVVNGTLYGNPPPSPYSQGYRIEGSSNLIQHNSVESCIAGIVSTASYTNITNNTALFNQDSGIQAWGSYVYIENNTASYNGKVASTFTNAGIVGTVSHSVIQNNTCHYNLAYGLAIWSSGYNVTLRINVLQHNYYAGIIVRYSTVMNLTYNNITDSNYGIVILGIYNDQIHATYNNITNMFYAGFQLQGIKHSIFASNYLGNVSSGFYHEYLGSNDQQIESSIFRDNTVYYRNEGCFYSFTDYALNNNQFLDNTCQAIEHESPPDEDQPPSWIWWVIGGVGGAGVGVAIFFLVKKYK